MKAPHATRAPRIREALAAPPKLNPLSRLFQGRLLIPEQMNLRPGRVTVAHDGALTFEASPSGPHRLAHARVTEGPYREDILRRLLTAPTS